MLRWTSTNRDGTPINIWLPECDEEIHSISRTLLGEVTSQDLSDDAVNEFLDVLGVGGVLISAIASKSGSR